MTAGHDHHQHQHQHAPATFGRAFAIGITLNSMLVAAQIVYGIRAHALALVADAVHNLGDVLGLVLAWAAIFFAKSRPSPRYTYGLRSASIYAALINAILLLSSNGAIAWEALRRFAHPTPVAGGTVVVVATVGIFINGATAWLFMRGRAHDLNIRGAFLHMAADAAVSLGVVIAGLLILKTGWLWLDPFMSLVIVAVITWGTWGLLRDSASMALHAAPAEVDLAAVRAYLAGLPGVTAVNDLHIWAMSTTETALTAHLVIPELTCHDQLLSTTCHELHHRFDIDHPTLQIDRHPNATACILE